MNHYFMKLSARIDCSCCTTRTLVEVSEDLDAAEEVLYCLDDQITDAISRQKEQDGWVSGYCPKCSRMMAPAFAHLEDADDFCSRDKSEDIY